jgi:hypothetical protein
MAVVAGEAVETPTVLLEKIKFPFFISDDFACVWDIQFSRLKQNLLAHLLYTKLLWSQSGGGVHVRTTLSSRVRCPAWRQMRRVRSMRMEMKSMFSISKDFNFLPTSNKA